MSIRITRRDFTAFTSAVLLSPQNAAQAVAQNETTLIARAIPSSGQSLPSVGLGTAAVFDTNDETTRGKASAVIEILVKNGGRLIDTASTYGAAESVLGSIIASGGRRDELFIATKLESPDPEELKRSLMLLKTTKLDLLQLHNVKSKQQSLEVFRDWKKRGICRYIGITSTSRRDYPAVEAVLEREKPDFVQIDYSLDNREAEKRILPLAADVRAGVLTALPYGRGRLFRTVRGKELPEWAREFANSWGQFFLKYLLSDPRVTAVIPGTSDPAHMADNAGAMRGSLPGPDLRRRMVAFVETL